MTFKRLLTALSFPLFFASVSSCELAEDITKSEFDREVEYITSVWKVDSIRVTEYAFIPFSNGTVETPLISSRLLPVTKMEFIQSEGTIPRGIVIQTSIENGKEVVNELTWYYRQTYLDLYFPSVFLGGLAPSATIFDMVEISNKRFVFERKENLVSNTNGAKYGSFETYYYLSK